VKKIILGDNAKVLSELPDGFARLIYIDPPFNTGKKRTGLVGEYKDSRDAAEYLNWLTSRIEKAFHKLTPNGSLFVHLDYREVHYVKVAIDQYIGRDHFMNEIIWAYDYGGRPKNRWPCKHDTILWYVRDPENYVFNYDEMDRIPYMAPGLVGPEKAALGKTPTDVWWHTIVPTNGKEKTGYPTQKPLGILNRIIKVHSNPGDVVLDFFAGSGTTGEAAARNDRGFVLVDSNPEAFAVMRERLAWCKPELLVLPSAA
jgi:site-specific DNA-methyltransferase (adenine-specific)